MNIRLSLHNVLMITVLAILGILAVRTIAKTGVRNVPVVGDILAAGAGA